MKISAPLTSAETSLSAGQLHLRSKLHAPKGALSWKTDKSKLVGFSGPSDRDRTCGLMVPNHPRSQLRHTRISIRFFLNFAWKWDKLWSNANSTPFWVFLKCRKSALLKAFRDFCFSMAITARHAPKSSSLPTVSHLVVFQSCNTKNAFKIRGEVSLPHYKKRMFYNSCKEWL